MKIHDLRVKPVEDNPGYYQIFLDGMEIHNVTRLQIVLDGGKMPIASISTVTTVDIDLVVGTDVSWRKREVGGAEEQ